MRVSLDAPTCRNGAPSWICLSRLRAVASRKPNGYWGQSRALAAQLWRWDTARLIVSTVARGSLTSTTSRL